uniref:Uncharacterized protein n=1 Tax=Oryza glumipatula TaxID=40148 RepID=A0A0D9Z108_9ORYZ
MGLPGTLGRIPLVRVGFPRATSVVFIFPHPPIPTPPCHRRPPRPSSWWPVPMPYWCHPDCVEDESEDVEDESEDDEELEFSPTFGCKLKYNYINGEKTADQARAPQIDWRQSFSPSFGAALLREWMGVNRQRCGLCSDLVKG